jgi:ABC-type transport system involved in cytochrome c biogenesis permease subunit
MNNPLRYRGETFYQQSFDDQTEQTTILQVAQNEGYMLPYLSCMLVFLGMVWHFGLALTRFMSHRAQAERSQTPAARGLVVESWPRLIAPTLAAAATAAVFAYSMVPQSPPPEDLQIAEFGELPVLDDGRVKPFDTLARVTLQFLAARQEAPTQVPKQLEDGTKTSAEKIPAMQWLLDVMTAQPKALDYPVFRIENLEVLDQLGLEPRQGFFRYSFNEIDNRIRDLSDAAFAAFEKAKSGEKLTTYEKKLTELWNKRNQFVELSTSFGTPDLRGGESLRETAERAIANAKRLREANAPRAVFPEQADGQWLTFYEAALLEPVAAMQNIPPHPATAALRRALAAYADNNAKDFNDAVAQLKDLAADYEQRLRAPSNAAKLADMKPAETLRMEILAREAWLNTASLFYVASITYLIAFLFACTSWLVWQQQLSRVSLAIIGVTLLVHTFAIWQRTEISGRPPITNLYDTTICVGWACVLLGVVFEVIYRLGIGSFVASSIGFCTLIIGHYLSQDGDTFTVLQAVLDTNFWLTVHVISINLGYATTVLAGAFGVVWVLFYHLLGRLDDRGEQQVSRMIYGTVCFAILFSFVGTVLGGLWADDSWGRFWGWDPKENGAMMVVLWNAIVLHARWGGIARRRGVALLAIFGNIITAWSWFGTNGLGIGLHAYGFRDGAALNLVLFCVANLAIIAAGAIRWRTVSTSTASLSRNA